MKKAVITVSESMSEKSYKALEQGVRDRFEDELSITKQVDPTLIGGFILTVDGVIYDNSIRTQLEQIKKELQL